MLVKIEKPKDLSEAISIISEVVTEVRIKLLPEGMSIIAVDPANVSMVIFKIPKESFSQYENGREVWSVNLEDLKRILKRANTASSILLEQEENQLKIAIFDKVKRNFVLSLIEIDSEEKDEPALSFSSRVEMDAESLSQSIEDCLVVADSCSFVSSGNTFLVEGSGSLNSAKAEYSLDEVKLSGQAKSKYSLEYLSKFMKAKKISSKVLVNFGDDYPLRLEFPGEKMGMAFILAPRVENN
jgi:proliferating cell nuclear antigen